MKKRRNLESTNNSGNCEFSAIEICEEGRDENSQLKSNPVLPLQVLYSQLEDRTKNGLKKISSFTHYYSYPSSGRYLKFRTFRI